MTSQAMRLTKKLVEKLPDSLRNTAKVRLFGLLKIPMIFYVGPDVAELDDQHVVVVIPLGLRTKNHFNSMYFGALATGADLGCGLLAQHLIDSYADGKMSLLFKDFKAEFLKRAEGDTHFICSEGEKIKQTVQAAKLTGERQNVTVQVLATVPTLSGNEPVAKFELTLSLKASRPKN